jgi:hypothetical protein
MGPSQSITPTVYRNEAGVESDQLHQDALLSGPLIETIVMAGGALMSVHYGAGYG